MSGGLSRDRRIVLRATDRSWRTREDLAGRASRLGGGWTGNVAGISRTLGVLGRAGLVERRTLSGRVHWHITDAGADYLHTWNRKHRDQP